MKRMEIDKFISFTKAGIKHIISPLFFLFFSLKLGSVPDMSFPSLLAIKTESSLTYEVLAGRNDRAKEKPEL